MSQQAVEALVGRLICDDEFREAFFAEPSVTAEQHGLRLSWSELDCLRSIPQAPIAALASGLDDRIRRSSDLRQRRLV